MGAFQKSGIYPLTMKQCVNTIKNVLESFHREHYGYDDWVESIHMHDMELSGRECVFISASDKKGVFHTCFANFRCMEGEDVSRTSVTASYCDCGNDLPRKTIEAVLFELEDESQKNQRRVRRRLSWLEDE
jgi:hypothetical protein